MSERSPPSGAHCVHLSRKAEKDQQAAKGLEDAGDQGLQRCALVGRNSIELLTPLAEQMDVAVISQHDGFLAI